MSLALSVSEGVSIAFHSVVFVARNPGRRWSSRDLAERLRFSRTHLNKVMRKLVAAGLLNSVTGPGGGFKLAKPPSKITLLKIYEAVEGPLRQRRCLFDTPICNGHKCILGNLIPALEEKVKRYIRATYLSDVSDVYGDKYESTKKYRNNKRR